MKGVEARLRELPQIAQESGLEAGDALKERILRAERRPARPRYYRAAVILAAAAVLVLVTVAVMPLMRHEQAPMLTGQSAGGATPTQAVLTGDVKGGSVVISSGGVPEYRSIWAKGQGANFPLICAEDRYYRMLDTPSRISESLIGRELGTVSVYTQEPALTSGGIISNIVPEGEKVWTLSGMDGTMAAAYVNGSLRVFQRVAYSGNAILGGETLKDTLRAGTVTELALSGVGSVSGQQAQELFAVLLRCASYQNAKCAETGQTLLIYMDSGLVLQLCVSGETVSGCGTWSCPDFLEAFPAGEET